MQRSVASAAKPADIHLAEATMQLCHVSSASMQLGAAQRCRRDPPLKAGHAADHPLLLMTKTGLRRAVVALFGSRKGH